MLSTPAASHHELNRASVNYTNKSHYTDTVHEINTTQKTYNDYGFVERARRLLPDEVDNDYFHE